jgi:hypothetical protein
MVPNGLTSARRPGLGVRPTCSLTCHLRPTAEEFPPSQDPRTWERLTNHLGHGGQPTTPGHGPALGATHPSSGASPTSHHLGCS